MSSRSKHFRIYRVAFIVAVAWVIGLVCFREQLLTISKPESNAIYWLATGILASVVSLFWAAKVNPETRYGQATCVFELVLFNLALSLVLLELSLRVYSVATNDPMTLSTREKDVALVSKRRTDKKKHVQFGFPFNSEGFYDTEFIRPKPDDVYRILVLGDSFGVGAVPYSHLYLTLLEKELEGLEPGKRIEVCNAGINSTAPAHYLALLNQIGESLEPDLVMVAFFVGNDFNKSGIEESFKSPWDSLMIYRVPVRFMRMSQAKTEYVTWEPLDKETKLVVPKYADDWRLENPTMPREMFLKIQAFRAFVFSKLRKEESYEFGCHYVRKIAEEARALTDNPLVMFIIPDENQVNAELRADVDSYLAGKDYHGTNWSPEKWDLEKPNRILNSVFDPDNIVVMDLLPAIRQAEVDLERTYHLNDTHWNSNGNRAAAEELGRMLREQWKQVTK